MCGVFDWHDDVEVVNFRLTALALRRTAKQHTVLDDATDSPSTHEVREVWFDPRAPIGTPVYQRATLRPGHLIEGPAVVEQLDSTTLVWPGQSMRVDRYGQLVLGPKPEQ